MSHLEMREPALLPVSNADSDIHPNTGPPKAWQLAADWGNTLAGIFLMGSFLEGALINSVKMSSLLSEKGPTVDALNWLQFLFCTEGALYAIAEFFMVGIMAMTPVEFGGGSRGCLQFAILMAGGIFFSFSGLANPGCITNVTYLFRKEACPAFGPYVWNAVAHFGITCFMVGTTIGFLGILKAPKDKFISPFWGCTMYFLGAWVIGVFVFWGPVLAGGFDVNQNAHSLDMTVPVNTWTWRWWFGLVGAFFLELGAVIFGLMSGSFGIRCG